MLKRMPRLDLGGVVRKADYTHRDIQTAQECYGERTFVPMHGKISNSVSAGS